MLASQQTFGSSYFFFENGTKLKRDPLKRPIEIWLPLTYHSLTRVFIFNIAFSSVTKWHIGTSTTYFFTYYICPCIHSKIGKYLLGLEYQFDRRYSKVSNNCGALITLLNMYSSVHKCWPKTSCAVFICTSFLKYLVQKI